MVYDIDSLKMPSVPLPVASVSIQKQPQPVFYKKPLSRFSRRCIASLFLLVFLLLIRYCYPSGAELLRELLTAEKIGPMEQAGQTMIFDIFSGTPIPEAFAVFCREIYHAIH